MLGSKCNNLLRCLLTEMQQPPKSASRMETFAFHLELCRPAHAGAQTCQSSRLRGGAAADERQGQTRIPFS
eukprot:6177111-Pleurochrysis_carterae.AAC.1